VEWRNAIMFPQVGHFKNCFPLIRVDNQFLQIFELKLVNNPIQSFIPSSTPVQNLLGILWTYGNTKPQPNISTASIVESIKKFSQSF
jgi:hypothetical protein